MNYSSPRWCGAGLPRAASAWDGRSSLSARPSRRDWESNSVPRSDRPVGLFRLLLLLGAVCLLGCTEGPYIPADYSPNLVEAAKIRAGLESATEGPAEETAAVELAQPTGYATLQGRFTVQGTPPTPAALTIDKDRAVCAPGGQAVYDGAVQVSADGGLANVLVFVDEAPDDWIHESARGTEEIVEFDQQQCVFLTRVATVQTTQRLKILNSDPIGHNTNMEPRRNAPMNQNIPSRGFVLYPPQAGPMQAEQAPFSVKCNVHPWMQAWMIIRPNAYYAVSGEDGSFEIPNLPAGVDVRLFVWHERPGFLADAAVEVDSPVVQEWNRRGNVTVRLQPDQVATLDVAVDSSALQ